MALWKGNSEDGLCGPMIVPSGFTQMMSFGVSDPLSIPPGVIQMSPFSSLIEMLPPEVVVNPLR